MEIPALDELLKNLKHQVTLYRRLIDLCREEKNLIVGARYKELRDATYSKEALVDEIQREEFRRKRWVAEAARALGMSESDVTLETVGNRIAPRDQWEPILSLKNTLLVLVKKSSEMNRDNRALVEVALRDAQQMKKNVLGLSSDAPQTYGPKGHMGGGFADKSARLLNKEA
ncbi:MAG: flagellar protein FlgN [Bdellovibrionales bacterium]|nr:flagellar protein FlgN [Bdellovibrionales bacterium]